MTRKSTERLLWFLGTAGIVGLIAYLFAVGLDKADKLGSVIGCLAALVSLAMAAMFRARTNAADEGPTVSNTIRDARIDGTVIQSGEVRGSITLSGDINDPAE